MKVSALCILLTCALAAFGQTNTSFYVATTGKDSNPALKRHLGSLFNTPQTPRGPEVLFTFEGESTKSW